MRFFYTDALKAAWMHQEFGIDFHYDLEDFNVEILGSYYVRTKNYIHPKCHETLKPQVGDIGAGVLLGDSLPLEFMEGYNGRSNYWGDSECIEFEGKVRVIFRNGKAFFTPESEE